MVLLVPVDIVKIVNVLKWANLRHVRFQNKVINCFLAAC